MVNFQELATAALDQDDWGGPRHVEAQNAFMAQVERAIPRAEFDALETYCLKATTDEMVGEAMRLLRARGLVH